MLKTRMAVLGGPLSGSVEGRVEDKCNTLESGNKVEDELAKLKGARSSPPASSVVDNMRDDEMADFMKAVGKSSDELSFEEQKFLSFDDYDLEDFKCSGVHHVLSSMWILCPN